MTDPAMDEQVIKTAKRLIVDLQHATTGANVHKIGNLLFPLRIFTKGCVRLSDADLKCLESSIEEAQTFLIHTLPTR